MPLIDLSHTVEDGMTTYPGLPGPVISDHMTFDESRSHYAPGVEFHIGRIDLVGNTGTYLDTPAHRWRAAEDLAGLSLEKVAAVPGIVVSDPGPALGAELLAGRDLTGRAVLFHTGWDRHWGAAEYGGPDHPHVSEDLARLLVANDAAVVGIDSVNIDSTTRGDRPAHSLLLGTGIPVVEHLTGLDSLPRDGFEFFAVPVKVKGLGTFPVRAFARW